MKEKKLIIVVCEKHATIETIKKFLEQQNQDILLFENGILNDLSINSIDERFEKSPNDLYVLTPNDYFRLLRIEHLYPQAYFIILYTNLEYFVRANSKVLKKGIGFINKLIKVFSTFMTFTLPVNPSGMFIEKFITGKHTFFNMPLTVRKKQTVIDQFQSLYKKGLNNNSLSALHWYIFKMAFLEFKYYDLTNIKIIDNVDLGENKSELDKIIDPVFDTNEFNNQTLNNAKFKIDAKVLNACYKNIENINSVFKSSQDCSEDEKTKFILFSYPRSGSNMLISALQGHSDLITFGELFHGNKVFYDNEIYVRRSLVMDHKKLRNLDPVKFLNRFIWRNYSDEKNIGIGFKLFNDHLRNLKKKDEFLEYLKNESSIKYIHLYREDILASFISFKKALLDNNWRKTGEERKKSSVDPIHISIQECEEYFVQLETDRKLFKEISKDKLVIEIKYEDLISDYNNSIFSVFDFIGVSRTQTLPKTHKQSKSKPEEGIENYDELKLYFKNTRWEKYFN